MRRLRTWLYVSAAAALALLLGQRIGEAAWLDPDNMHTR